MKYKHRLFLYFLLIFTLFSVGILLFARANEKKLKTEALKEQLNIYTEIANAAIYSQKELNIRSVVHNISTLFPEKMRFTLIDNSGNVLYDNKVLHSSPENHTNRPEIIAANSNGTGSDIRVSESNHIEYLYYAQHFGAYYIRVALPYDIQLRHVLQPDNQFLYFLVVVFLLMIFLINYVSERFGKSIRQVLNLMENGKMTAKIPKDELGEIAKKIITNYQQLNDSRQELAFEREKLLQHVHNSEEGICFFTTEAVVEFYNGLFVQYINTITDESNIKASAAISDPAFEQVSAFLQTKNKTEHYFETQISKQGKIFVVRVNVFNDSSFEIIINNITNQEKNRLLKQEMTGNITHELRTPVTGIRGYLETVLNNPLDKEKERYFIERAYNQTLALSELISDMGLLTKIDDSPHSFAVESVNIKQLLDELCAELEIPLCEKNITMEWNIADNVFVRGNRNLLYSIFRNLTDNAIRYAGRGINISVNIYNEDANFYYFSYTDNGTGIAEQHLNRLFERFYRINEGRTRETGGSGLGLSIVKNAVAFHRGTIVAKNRIDGGLEFLFSLCKIEIG